MPQFKWITEGSDSCFSCTRWNNKIYKKISEVPDLPVHPNCRCRIQVIPSQQDLDFIKIGEELKHIKEQSQKDLYDLSAFVVIPFLLERLIEAASDLRDKIEQGLPTLKIFWDNYWAMREADFIGADEYFHSKANAEAAQLGEKGEAMAKFISDAREFIDYYKNLHLKKLSLEATIEDAKKDQKANRFGREQGRKNPHADARDLLEPLRPRGLDDKY